MQIICVAAAYEAKWQQCALPYLFFQFFCWLAFTQRFPKALIALADRTLPEPVGRHMTDRSHAP